MIYRKPQHSLVDLLFTVQPSLAVWVSLGALLQLPALFVWTYSVLYLNILLYVVLHTVIHSLPYIGLLNSVLS